MEKTLRTNLIPLYNSLLGKNILEKNIYTFCMQWGNQFPQEEKNGILFVGKATNGWITNSKNIELLFGETEKRVFARGDQMKWVGKLENNVKGYNTRKSAFWRIIKRVAEHKNGKNEWFSKIAWSNLYKLSFEKGNPNEKLKKNQIEICKKILETEINILNPKYLIFFTSSWEQEFVKYLTNGKKRDNEINLKWGKNYKTFGFTVDNLNYIISVHPQGKSEDEHFKKIDEIMKHLG
ncbi:hypothetical protein [Flavobacterium psychrophilum]|uniref:hypothetical protein n=1 Tax=Flavobacterium psychrophilum TaxID=96345 RepID=UPI000A3ACEA3|nr:hypothetical protein [Flavobacterium psychrophilum]OUD24858.1 hypothetical protein FPG92_12525 [Flavobacterium psychrophilum]